MPLPRAMLRLPISSTAKVMYARMLDIVFVSGIEDTNGILFIHFPIVELAAALARSTMTVKRSLNELEDAGLILRVRQGFGEPNKIYLIKNLNPKITGWKNYYSTKRNEKWMQALDWYIICTFTRWYNKKHQRRNRMSKVGFVRNSIYEKGLKKMARA